VKLAHALIRNFKGVKEVEIDFASSTPGVPRQLTALLGDNGSGKTTVLQAIALTLSMATERTFRIGPNLDWHGFNDERISTLGQTHIELDVRFDADEIELVQRLFRDWGEAHLTEEDNSRRPVLYEAPPAENEIVTLIFDGRCLESPQGYEGINQFRGRYFVRQLGKSASEERALLRRLGDVFWFQQDRGLDSVKADRQSETEKRDWDYEPWVARVENLRGRLVEFWAHHTSPNTSSGVDYLALLEEQFGRIFRGTRFVGTSERGGQQGRVFGGSYFYLEREGKRYDLAEMSSGEQAIFVLAYEFVRRCIARSVVLIDELELHLHPPQQQALLGALRKLGEDCQFIITTHSPFLEEVIPREEVKRLPGGRPCL